MPSAPGLVQQLQEEAMNGSVPVTDLLRKAKVVAVKLGQNDLAQWLELEMNGYNGVDVPKYREAHARLEFLNPVRGWCPVIGGDHASHFRNPIGEIAALLESDGDRLTASVPLEVVKKVSESVGFEVDVRKVIGRASIDAIADAVRNIVLNWALRLEQLGIHGEGMSFSSKEAAKAQSVVFNIQSIQNAAGLGIFGDNARITANQSVSVGELAKKSEQLARQLTRILSESGLPSEIQAQAAKQAAELKSLSEASKPDAGKMRKVLESLQRTMEGAAGNLIASGVVAEIAKLLW